MSSHHVVREKQEPALLVLDLDGFSSEYLGQLLEWSPTVIATPETFELLYSEGIKVDWLVTTDHINDLQNNVKLITGDANEYISVALQELVKNGYTAVNIITDKVRPEVFEHYGDKITITMFFGYEKLFAIRSGYEKWLPANDVISLLQSPNGLKTTGLEKISATQFKTITDGFIRIEFDLPLLLISESIN